MKILNFFPLLVWSLAWPLVSTFVEHLTDRSTSYGAATPPPSRWPSAAVAYAWGLVAWLIVGVTCLVVEL